MTLIELLENINDNMTVIVNDTETQKELCRYDGRDAIDEQYNECTVFDIVASAENELTIDIDTF